jgi:hypothetical protein
MSGNGASVLVACALVGALVVSGCAAPGGSGGAAASAASTSGTVASEATAANVARVGFLTNYARLQPMAGGGGMLCWRDAGVNWKQYTKVMPERIQVYIKPGSQHAVDPTDLKMLIDYFHADLVKAIAEMGAGAATGRPVGSTPYLGQTGMEVQFRDGASGQIVAECADVEIGLKYAADLNAGAAGAAESWVSGYMDSFSQWTYAKNAFDKWSADLARRFAALRNG